MSKSKKPYIKIWLNPDDDSDLVDWWESLPAGERSKVGRKILRAGLETGGNTDKPPSQQPIDLGAIRQVFESVLESKLNSLALVQRRDEDQTDVDPLQSLDDSFLVD
jgi:hypothetical protein